MEENPLTVEHLLNPIAVESEPRLVDAFIAAVMSLIPHPDLPPGAQAVCYDYEIGEKHLRVYAYLPADFEDGPTDIHLGVELEIITCDDQGFVMLEETLHASVNPETKTTHSHSHISMTSAETGQDSPDLTRINSGEEGVFTTPQLAVILDTVEEIWNSFTD